MTPMAFIMTNIFNFVDNADIQSPLKAILKPSQVFFLKPEEEIREQIYFSKHLFSDHTARVQLLYEEEETSYLELDRIAFNSMPPIGHEPRFVQIIIALSEKEVLQSRRVYDSTDIFGDVGGILSIMVLFGKFFNFLLTGNEFASQALGHYFSLENPEGS